MPSTDLYPSTSKRWSDHTPQWEHFTPLHQLAGWYPHCWEQTKPAQRSHDSSLFWHLSGETNSDQCQDSRITFHLSKKLKTPLFRLRILFYYLRPHHTTVTFWLYFKCCVLMKFLTRYMHFIIIIFFFSIILAQCYGGFYRCCYGGNHDFHIAWIVFLFVQLSRLLHYLCSFL